MSLTGNARTMDTQMMRAVNIVVAFWEDAFLQSASFVPQTLITDQAFRDAADTLCVCTFVCG